MFKIILFIILIFPVNINAKIEVKNHIKNNKEVLYIYDLLKKVEMISFLKITDDFKQKKLSNVIDNSLNYSNIIDDILGRNKKYIKNKSEFYDYYKKYLNIEITNKLFPYIYGDINIVHSSNYYDNKKIINVIYNGRKFKNVNTKFVVDNLQQDNYKLSNFIIEKFDIFHNQKKIINNIISKNKDPELGAERLLSIIKRKINK